MTVPVNKTRNFSVKWQPNCGIVSRLSPRPLFPKGCGDYPNSVWMPKKKSRLSSRIESKKSKTNCRNLHEPTISPARIERTTWLTGWCKGWIAIYSAPYNSTAPLSQHTCLGAHSELRALNPWTVKQKCHMSSFERVNGFQYYENWLQNLLISASLGGYRKGPPNPL